MKLAPSEQEQNNSPLSPLGCIPQPMRSTIYRIPPLIVPSLQLGRCNWDAAIGTLPRSGGSIAIGFGIGLLFSTCRCCDRLSVDPFCTKP